MKFNSKLALTFVAAAFIASVVIPAAAQTINGNVRSGKEVRIYNFSAYDPNDCGALAYPKVSFKQPANGSLRIKKYVGKLIGKKFKGSFCYGKTAKGLAVYYRSNRGFRGLDRARVSFSFPAFVDGSGYDNVKSLKFNITVK